MKFYKPILIYAFLSIFLGVYLAQVVENINRERINTHITANGNENYKYVIGVFEQIDHSVKNLSLALTHYFDLPMSERSTVLSKIFANIKTSAISSVLENIAVFNRVDTSEGHQSWILLAYNGEDYRNADINRDFSHDYPDFFTKVLQGESFSMQVVSIDGIPYGFFASPIIDDQKEVVAVLVGATEFVKNGYMILDDYERKLAHALPNYYAKVTWPDGTCAAVWDYEHKHELSCQDGAQFVASGYSYGPVEETYFGALTKYYAGERFIQEHLFLEVNHFVMIYAVIVLLIGFYLWRMQHLNFAQQQLNGVLEKNLQEQIKLNEAKDTFLSNMSHELRTPLNGIYGTFQALSFKNKTDSKLIQMGMRASEILTQILNDILDMQKIASNKMSIEPAWFSIDDLLEEIIILFESSALHKGIDLKLAKDHQLPSQINCDRVRLSQVLTNLVSNAIKFTEHGLVSVKCQYEERRQILTITVSDTGIGMDDVTLSKIFQRFVQADSSSTKHFGGTGLGLAISQELSRMMGGEITVSSSLGKGTSFELILPIDYHQSEVVQEKIEYPDLEQSRLRILVVDDDDININVVQDILLNKYQYVDVALSAKAAIVILERNHFDIVVTDISMPGMDGFELLNYINIHFPETEVIALTGNVFEHQRQQYVAAGFRAVLDKPMDYQTLLSTLDEVAKETKFPDFFTNKRSVLTCTTAIIWASFIVACRLWYCL